MKPRLSNLNIFRAILVSVLVVGCVLVGFTVTVVKMLDRWIIEEAAGKNRQAEFLRATEAVTRVVSQEGLKNTTSLARALQDIQIIRPGILWLDVLEVRPAGMAVVLTSRSREQAGVVTAEEADAITSGHSMAMFDRGLPERAWIITAPIVYQNAVIGAVRGRFSISKYDALIMKQQQVAIVIAIGAIVISSVVFLMLIRAQVHRPLSRLLATMEQIRSGDLSLRAPVAGPLEIQRLSAGFNQMLDEVRHAIREKEALIEQVKGLNSTLEERVSKAVEALQVANRKLVQSQIQAERNERLAALGEVSAVMAHELGNPLNAVSGRLQLLETAADSGQREKHLAVIRSQIARMITVIRHILDSTRVDMEVSRVDVNQVIQEVLPLVHHSGVTVQADLSDHPPLVRANRAALYGMLLNVTMNAVQAMPNGGSLHVRTETTQNAPPPGYVILTGPHVKHPMARIQIRDTGVGIPPDLFGRICEPFFTSRHKEGGTGLGLAICRRVISSLGGRLSVESVLSTGTTFTIDVPLWTEEAG